MILRTLIGAAALLAAPSAFAQQTAPAQEKPSPAAETTPAPAPKAEPSPAPSADSAKKEETPAEPKAEEKKDKPQG